ILGGKEFVSKIKDRFFLAKTNREVPSARHLAPTVREVLDAVLSAYEAEEATLSVSRRGATNEPRDVTMHLLRTLCGQPLQQIAQSLSVRTYSTVSTTLTRVAKRLAQDEAFKKRVERVRALLKKSQNET
ncbi:MAG: transposase, partial [Deltaproteobacteria bacterium]|nr:transposase [Deltaproteobacteria bacterium]